MSHSKRKSHLNLASIEAWLKAKWLQSKSVIGIDIGTSNIKLLELNQLSSHYQVANYAIVHLPANAVVEKEIKDSAAVSKAIRQAFTLNQFQSNTVVIAVPDSAVISKIVQFNTALRAIDIENQLILDADQHIPYPLEEINLDHQVLGVNPKNAEKIDVLVVASHKNNVDARVTAVTAAGLQMKAVDVESYAIERTSAFLFEQFPKHQKSCEQTIAIVDLGVTTFTFAVIHHKEIIFTRTEMLSSTPLSQTSEKHCAISSSDAVLHIRRALQFFFSSHPQNEIHHIVLAGGSALTPDLPSLVFEQLNISTLLANPFLQMKIAKGIDATELMRMAPIFLVSCGLALWGG